MKEEFYPLPPINNGQFRTYTFEVSNRHASISFGVASFRANSVLTVFAICNIILLPIFALGTYV